MKKKIATKKPLVESVKRISVEAQKICKFSIALRNKSEATGSFAMKRFSERVAAAAEVVYASLSVLDSVVTSMDDYDQVEKSRQLAADMASPPKKRGRPRKV